jgi:hypothetical protein
MKNRSRIKKEEKEKNVFFPHSTGQATARSLSSEYLSALRI